MVRGVGLGERGILVGIGLPVEAAAVDDDTAERTAVATDELGGRVYHDVGAVLERTEEIGGAKGVVDHHDGVVAVSYLADAVYVGDAGVGVAEGLYDDGLGVGTEGCLDLVKVGGVYDGRCHALSAQRVFYQVECAAVEIVGGYDVVTVDGHILQGVGHCSRSRSHCQCCHSAFKCCHALLKCLLGGVGQSAVDVAGIAQGKAVGGVLGVAEHVRGGLVDRHGAGVGGGVGLLLAYVQLKGLETVLLVAHNTFLSNRFWLVCGPK